MNSLRVFDYKTVGDFATAVPNATVVFEKMGIDYCCGGQQSLAVVCQQKGITLDQLWQAVDESKLPTVEFINWQEKTLRSLIEHILTKHHTYTTNQLARLQNLAEKVFKAHGERHPELADVNKYFFMLQQDLLQHMMKEEQILFPYVLEMEQSTTSGHLTYSCFGTVRNPINMMNYEHEVAGNIFREFHKLTNDFIAPADGCLSYQAFYQGLAELEQDLHQHIHLESNILFPRATILEDTLRQKQSLSVAK